LTISPYANHTHQWPTRCLENDLGGIILRITDVPIHQRLWDVTLPAVRAAWLAAQTYIESDKYVPRFLPPSFEENDSGWPSTVADKVQLRVPSSAPIEWSRMFALTRSDSTYVTVEDVPELGTALAAVSDAAKEDVSFADGMNMYNFSQNIEHRERSLQWDYLAFVSSIVARADATDVDSDDELLQIYLQLERARFAQELTGDLVVPLTLIDFGSEQPLHLGSDAYIEALSPELQCSRAPSLRNFALNPYLVAAATHAVVVRGITLSNQPYSTRVLGRFGGLDPIGADHLDKVDHAVQCIHMISGRKTGYNEVLVRPHHWADSWVHGVRRVMGAAGRPRHRQRGCPAGPQRLSITRDKVTGGARPHHHTYASTLPRYFPLKDYQGDIRIEEQPHGSLIVWTVTCASRIPGLNKLFRSTVRSTYVPIVAALAQEAERTAPSRIRPQLD
jgi:hypothetical protein